MKNSLITIVFVMLSLASSAQNDSLGQFYYKKHLAVQNLTGKKAAEFSALTLDGKLVNLAALKGRVIVLSVWTTSCLPCIKEINSFKAFKNKYKKDKIVYIAIAPIDTQLDITKFLSRHSLDFEIWYAPSSNFVKDYGADSYPTNYVIDKNGFIVYSQVGYDEKNTYNEISEAVKKYI